MNLLLETARNGKIAHLPRDLRDKLNLCIYKGETLVRLRRWLNELPEVKAILKEYFDGRPILQQNLSEWKAGGYRQWLIEQEMLERSRDLTADAHALAQTAEGLADDLFGMVTLDYARTLMKRDPDEDPSQFEKKRKTLSVLTQDITRLRRCDINARRVEMQEDKVDREQEKTLGQLFTLFTEWVSMPDVRKMCILAPQERDRRLRQTLKLPPTREDLILEKELAKAPAFASPAKKQTENKPPQTENIVGQASRLSVPTDVGEPATESGGGQGTRPYPRAASPVGTIENSPAFQRRESNKQDLSPEGTAELKNTPVTSSPGIRPIGPISNSKLNPQNPKPFVPSPYISDYEKAILEGKTPLEALYIQSAPPKSPPPKPASDPYDSFCQPANAPDRRPPPEPTPSQYYCRCPAPGHHFGGGVSG